jgi:SAM-dependent methyltransferase
MSIIMTKTTSSLPTSLRPKVMYLSQLLLQYKRKRKDNFGFHRLMNNIEEYQGYSEKYLGRPLSGLKALEIGYGPRPFLATALSARGADVFGIDLECPMLRPSVRSFVNIAHRNGTERALKSLVRLLVFGSHERAAFERTFHCSLGESMRHTYLIVGDAADPNAWRAIPNDLDLIISEDVFEHIPALDLPAVLRCMAEHMSGDGLALIRPNIWTGITGGHFVEWYHTNVDDVHRKGRPPWSHLRTGEGEPSVYLNRLTLRDYAALFSRDFDIVGVVNGEYGLGAQYLTPDVLAELPDGVSKDDLLTNNVMFAMRKRSGSGRRRH